jgi:hypothetical protein
MKNHNQISQTKLDSQLTFKELKTVGSLKPSEEKAPRPLPSACACWPQ